MHQPSVLCATLFFAAACGDDGSASVGGTTGTGAQASGGSGASTSNTGGSTTTSSGGSGGEGASTGGRRGDGTCAGSTFTLCEGFEDAADEAFPADWGPRGDEWGAGVIGVASDDAMFGAKSLKADGGNSGQHFVDYKGDLGALASNHYGRVYMKVAVPAPWPGGGVLHADFIEGLGPGPSGGTHNVRWGIVENTRMMFQWIYNVQPSNGDPEFGEGTGYVYTWTGEWQCIEWMYDQPRQHGMLWIDGAEIPIVPGANHAAEIPVFESLGVGLANYQEAGEGFTVWFDELAYDDERIGCAQ